MGVNCSICGIAPEEVEVIKKRGGGQVPPGAVHLFHPSFQATLMAGYDVNLHREYYGFHLMAQSFGEPLCFLIDGDAGYPGGLDGNYSDDQHCLRYVSLPRVKAIAEILSSLSFTQFVERGYAAFPPIMKCKLSTRPCKSCRPITMNSFRFIGVPPKTTWR